MRKSPHGQEISTFTVCEYHGSCDQIALPVRFVFGREGIAMQGTGIWDGKPIHGRFSGEWVPDPGKHSKDFFEGTVELFYGWGRPGREMVPLEEGAVGPSYVDQTYYVPILQDVGGSGNFRAVDRGGEIADGDIDIFAGRGSFMTYKLTTKGLKNPTDNVPIYSSIVDASKVVPIYPGR